LTVSDLHADFFACFFTVFDQSHQNATESAAYLPKATFFFMARFDGFRLEKGVK
jgi:hypothetical protein